jgi:hypothetical protein
MCALAQGTSGLKAPKNALGFRELAGGKRKRGMASLEFGGLEIFFGSKVFCTGFLGFLGV